MNIGKLYRRFWAYCFDIIIVCGIYFGILLIIKILGNNNTADSALKEVYKLLYAGISPGVIRGQAYYIALFYLPYGLIFFMYEFLFLRSKLSATPGKLTLGLEVVCSGHADFFKILLRSLLKVIVTLITPLTLFCFLISAFTKTRQSLHDKLTNTVVIIKNPQTHGTAPLMTLEDFFDEMKSRGLRMYSEQRALAEEIYGSPTPLCKPVKTGTNKNTNSMLGVLALVFSIIVCLSFISYSYSDIQHYVQEFISQYTKNQHISTLF